MLTELFQTVLDGAAGPAGRLKARLEYGPALKGLSPTAAVSRDIYVGCCVAGSSFSRFCTSETATSERHDDAVCPLSDHPCQFQTNPMFRRDGDRLTVDELTQYLNFQFTKLELHRSPMFGSRASYVFVRPDKRPPHQRRSEMRYGRLSRARSRRRQPAFIGVTPRAPRRARRMQRWLLPARQQVLV